MSISTGDTLPDATLLRMGRNGPEPVELASLTAGRKVVIFAVPAAFSTTCDAKHLPSFLRVRAALAEKGVDDIICISVNDPFVMGAWGESSGAAAAGIHMLGDSDATFTKAMGMNFTVPAIGFYDRSNRYALVAENGVVTLLQADQPGACDISTGESLLAAM